MLSKNEEKFASTAAIGRATKNTIPSESIDSLWQSLGDERRSDDRVGSSANDRDPQRNFIDYWLDKEEKKIKRSRKETKSKKNKKGA